MSAGRDNIFDKPSHWFEQSIIQTGLNSAEAQMQHTTRVSHSHSLMEFRAAQNLNTVPISDNVASLSNTMHTLNNFVLSQDMPNLPVTHDTEPALKVKEPSHKRQPKAVKKRPRSLFRPASAHGSCYREACKSDTMPGKRYDCHPCDRSFLNSMHLALHIKVHHPDHDHQQDN